MCGGLVFELSEGRACGLQLELQWSALEHDPFPSPRDQLLPTEGPKWGVSVYFYIL